jgi:hypothetical protein
MTRGPTAVCAMSGRQWFDGPEQQHDAAVSAAPSFLGSAWVSGLDGFNSNVFANNCGSGYGYGIQDAPPLVQVPMDGTYGGSPFPQPGYPPQMGGANMTYPGANSYQGSSVPPPWRGGPGSHFVARLPPGGRCRPGGPCDPMAAVNPVPSGRCCLTWTLMLAGPFTSGGVCKNSSRISTLPNLWSRLGGEASGICCRILILFREPYLANLPVRFHNPKEAGTTQTLESTAVFCQTEYWANPFREFVLVAEQRTERETYRP